MGRKLRTIFMRNDMIRSLVHLKGNAKTLILIEPLCGVPLYLIAPFVTWYMYELGVNDMQIGILVSIATVTQFAFAAFAGVICDKLGRKRTTMLGDFLGWTIPCVIWALSQNVWFFLAAMVLNSLEQVNQTAWNCLLIEDADRSETVNIYTWVSVAGLVSVFFVPISGLLILHFSSVVPLMRGLYLFFACSMAVKSLITRRYTRETTQGRIRIEETKGVSTLSLLKEYRYLIPVFWRNTMLRKALLFIVLINIASMVNGNFFSLYVIGTLGISEQYLALFPIIRSVLMMLFMFFLLPRLSALRMQIPVGTGLVLYIGAQILLIFCPPHHLWLLVLYTIAEAVALALVMPRRDTMVVIFTDEKERARTVSLLGAVTLLISAPFGSLIGLLSAVDRRYPFAFSIILYVLSLIVVLHMKEEKPTVSE